jgi:hypothetical protein
MRSLLLAFALTMPAPLLAECFTRETGSRPTRLEFGSDGHIDQIVVDGEIMTYRAVDPKSKFETITRVQSIFFGLRFDRSDGTKVKFTWSGDLPQVSDLKPGLSFEGVALTVGTGARIWTSAIEVMAVSQIEIDGCTYSVLEVKVRNGPKEKPEMTGTRWVDPWTLLTYKTEGTFYGQDGKVTGTQSTRAIHME